MDDKRKRGDDRRLKLDPYLVYGSLGSLRIRDSIYILDEQDVRKLVYPVGKFIAVKNIDKSDMNFIRMSENMEQVTCIAKSPNNKFLAVAEKLKNESVPQVSVFSFKSEPHKIEAEKRIYKCTETKSNSIIGLSFSHQDSRFLLVLTGPPDYLILFLDSRMKALASSSLGNEISRISISPKDNHMVCMSGKNYFKIMRVQENSFIPLSETIKRLPQNCNFTDHAWFEETKIILATEIGEIFIIQDNEIRQNIESNYMNKEKISFILPFKRGFMVGTDTGQFGLWFQSEFNDKQKNDLMEQDTQMDFLKKWRTDKKCCIVSMDISKREDFVAVAFSNNDICTIEMNQLLPSQEVLENLKNNEKFLKKEVKLDFLFNGFHNGPVTHIDVCLQRPLIVTASKFDSSIRIWNYVQQRCELARKFHVDEGENKDIQDINPLCSVGFHPSGYYLAAGFIDKLRIYHVLHSALKQYKELVIKGCTHVKFSQGGNLLAAAYPRPKSNHYQINIYDAYTLEFIHLLRGPTNQITDLIWGQRDAFIASCGLDGGIYEWNTQDWSRKDYTFNNNRFTSLIYDTPIGMLLSSGTETIKDKNDHEKVEQRSIVREIRIVQNGISQGKDQHVHDLGMQRVSQLNFIQSLYNTYGIIGGTEQGQIKIYSYIFNQMAFETIAVHQGEVMRIKSSPGGRYVFSAGSDGSVFIFQVGEIAGDGQQFNAKINPDAKNQLEDIEKINPKAQVVDDALADIVLFGRQDIDNYIKDQRKLKTDLDDLEQKTELKSQEEKKRFEKEIDDIKRRFNQELAAKDASYEQLKSQKSSVEKESANLFKNVENNHLKAVEELENLYERKLAFENEKYLQLEQQLMEERMKNKKQIDEFERKHSSAIEALKSQFSENFKVTERALDNNRLQADKIKITYEEIINQQDDEHENYIRTLHSKQKQKIDDLSVKLSQQTSLNENLKRDKEELIKDIQNKKEEIENKQKDISVLNNKLREAENKIQIQSKELEDRNNQLKQKEDKINEYKYKISDLQKSKHVLSFRTTEMRNQLEPKEKQITTLKDELFKLESEFQAMLKAQKQLQDKVKEQESQIKTQKDDIEGQHKVIKIKEDKIHKFTMQIHDCVQFKKDPKDWIEEMKILYKEYVLSQEIKQRQNDPKSIEEMSRHVKHLENSANQINKSSEKMMIRRDKEIFKRMNENQQLIHELNEIRKANKDYQTEIGNKTSELEKLKRNNEQLNVKVADYESKYSKQQGTADYFHQSDDYAPQQQAFLPPAFNRSGIQQNRMQSQPKQSGKVCKGPNFDKNKQLPFEIKRSSELTIQLQMQVQKSLEQEAQIKQLKKILRDRGIEDPIPDDDLESSQYNRPQSQGINSRF